MDFYQKYVKYKMKYSQLNNLVGGNPSNILTSNIPTSNIPMVTSILVTHNNRIRCLLDALSINSDTNAKFKNCAILKLIITQDSLSISLVYDGQLTQTSSVNKDHNKDKYFSNTDNTGEYFYTYTTGDEKDFTRVLRDLNLDLNDFAGLKPVNHTFYIIRHGDGKHNEAKADGTKINKTILGLLEDAKLTGPGKVQAISAGYALLSDLQNTKVNYLFASDLIRTRQTLKCIYDIIKVKLEMQNEKVYIVPCSHELDFKKTKKSLSEDQTQNCDAQQQILAQENRMSCKDFSKTDCAHTDGLYNDWGYYWKFYGKGSRSAPGMTKEQCRNTGVIKQMLNIINAR